MKNDLPLIEPYANMTDAERLAELQEELNIEDEVEEEQENHFRTKSFLPPRNRATTGL